MHLLTLNDIKLYLTCLILLGVVSSQYLKRMLLIMTLDTASSNTT